MQTIFICKNKHDETLAFSSREGYEWFKREYPGLGLGDYEVVSLREISAPEIHRIKAFQAVEGFVLSEDGKP